MRRDIIIKNWRWIVLTLIFWSIVFKCIPEKFYELGGDSAQYIILAESLSKGTGLRLVNYPQEPFSFYFPPVLCFLLSPIIYFFGRNFYLMHIVVAALGFFSLFFFYRIFKRYSDKRTAAVCVFFLATNWAFITYSTGHILSDVPYLFFSSFTLLMAMRYIEERSYFNKSALFVIIGLTLSYFTRYSGLILFLSIIAFLLTGDKKTRFGKIALIGIVFFLVFAVWSILEFLFASRLTSHTQIFFLVDPYAPDKGTVFSHPLQLIIRLITGINQVYTLLGDISFFYFMNKGVQLNDIVCGFVIIFVFLGLWLKFREDKKCILHYYFLFYLMLLFLWSFKGIFSEGIRYLLPALPFILFYFIIGFLKFLRFLTKRLYSGFLSAFVCIFLVFNLLNLIAIPKSSQINLNSLPVSFRNFVLLHEWINKNLTGKGVILSRKPSITFLYTGHKAVIFPYTSDSERIWKETAKDSVQYIIVDEFSGETYYYLSPVLYKYRDRLKLLYRIGNTGLFEIRQRG